MISVTEISLYGLRITAKRHKIREKRRGGMLLSKLRNRYAIPFLPPILSHFEHGSRVFIAGCFC